MNKIPYMLIVGEKEELDNVISVRRQGEGDLGTFSLEEFVETIKKEIESKLLTFN